jgi:hypothetical protein
MKKYEIYLPLKYNDGTEIEAEKIKQIREELIAVFGALTVSSQSLSQILTRWIDWMCWSRWWERMSKSITRSILPILSKP